MAHDSGVYDLIRSVRRVAVVGASGTSGKPANYVPAYLQARGLELAVVNPHVTEVLGLPAHAHLSEIGYAPDAVVVFRPASEAEAITRQALAIGAGAVWLQEGICSEEARALAADARIRFVMNRCIAVAFAEAGLGPAVTYDGVACPRPGI